MVNFKTIAFFTFPSEYLVLKLLFDQEIIDYVFLHVTMTGVLTFHSNALGGIRLQGHKKELQKIMNDLNDTSNLRIV
jgi:hypothetical protein